MSGENYPGLKPSYDYQNPYLIESEVECRIHYLLKPAYLEFGENILVIYPEKNIVCPSLQDYKIINIETSINPEGVLGISEEELDELLSNNGPVTDTTTEIPEDILFIPHGEQIYIREFAEQLGLNDNEDISDIIISNTEDGLTINNFNEDGPLKFYLHRDDKEIEHSEIGFNPIEEKKQDQLYQEFIDIFALYFDGEDLLEFEDEDKHLRIAREEDPNSHFSTLAIQLIKINNYPDLRVDEGYQYSVIRISPDFSDIIVVYEPEEDEFKVTGKGKAGYEMQLTNQQANELLTLAQELRYQWGEKK